MMVEYLYEQKQFQQALEIVKKMKERYPDLSPYLENQIIEVIYQQTGQQQYKHKQA